MKQSEILDPKFAKWKGLDRGTIKWNPTINKDRCTGCGMCVTSCGRNVFDFDLKKNNPILARPNNCMVGCTSCETWCIFDAISFPDKQYIKNLIKEKGLLAVAKKELAEKFSNKECCGGNSK